MKKIIGIQRVDYFSKKAQRQVSGYNIYCIYKAVNVVGTATKQFYMSDTNIEKNLANLSMNKVDELLDFQYSEEIYNQYGSLIGFLV